jgi:hypothetical protein
MPLGGYLKATNRYSMIITIRGDSIDITEIPLNHHIEWESLLNELNAEHIPGWYQDGKRMGVNVVEGKAHVFIYRTANTPPEPQILEILRRHGIA